MQHPILWMWTAYETIHTLVCISKSLRSLLLSTYPMICVHNLSTQICWYMFLCMWWDTFIITLLSVCLRKYFQIFTCVSLLQTTTPPKRGNTNKSSNNTITVRLLSGAMFEMNNRVHSWKSTSFGYFYHVVVYIECFPWVCSLKVVFPLQLVIVAILYPCVHVHT